MENKKGDDGVITEEANEVENDDVSIALIESFY